VRRLRVGDLQIDRSYRRVLRPDGQTELPHRMFDLLLLLMAEPHVLHSRNELFARVWPGVIVEDANLSQSVWMLRKALGAERKHWIRTVAKYGYVFEPPAAVEAIEEDPALDGCLLLSPASHGLPASSGLPATAGPVGRRITPRSVMKGARWAAALVAVVAVALLGFLHSGPAPASRPAPIAVALIEVGDRAAAAETRWPAKLLHAWLDFKLGHLPEVILLTEAHLAADASALAPRVILLASGQSPTDPEQVFIRARLADGGKDIELRGAASKIPTLVDELSQRLLAELLPERRETEWPELTLDSAAARTYSDAFAATLRRDWPAAVSAAKQATQLAPRFGLARLHLATAQARLGHTRAARENMHKARELLAPIPADALTVLDALQLAIDPEQPLQAAAAYGALAAAHPHRTGFALEQARLLGRAGHAEQALAILSRPTWDGQPAGIRIVHLLGLAQVRLLLGDPERARREAGAAAQLAEAGGAGWGLERGYALMMMAQADRAQHHDRADLALFEQAAEQFELAGSGINAIYARFHAELARSADGAHSPLLATLLAETRSGGHRSIEIDLLRSVAFRHYSAGQHAEYRMRLEQALATANEVGDPFWQKQLDLDLLNEDLMLGDLDSAERRVGRLQHAGLQGDAAIWVDQFGAYLAQIRGRHAQALLELDRSRKRAAGNGAADVPPLAAARLACFRAGLVLQQGKLARARSELARCSEPEHAFIRLIATLGSASADLLAGDRGATLERLQAVEPVVEAGADGPDRWLLSLQLGYLWTRAGEPERARRLYEYVLPFSRQAGYGWLTAHAELGLAEVAAVHGDWQTSAQLAASARRGVPDDAWLVTSRLDQLAVVAALAEGEVERATVLLAELDGHAHLLGDAMIQLELHSLMGGDIAFAHCDRDARMSLLAETGLRGATLDWLVSPLQAAAEQVIAQHDLP
jgi:cellulose synthase operon protein C